MSKEEFFSENFRKVRPNLHLKLSQSAICYLGTWPSGANYRKLNLVWTVCSFIIILGIFLLTEFIQFCRAWGNPKAMINKATLLLLTNIVHAYKYFIVVFRRKRIQRLVQMAESDDFGRNNVKYEGILSAYAWKGVFHYIVYQGLGAAAVIFWVLTPITDYVENRQRQLPMAGWYPYNETATPAFEITTSYQDLAIALSCIHNVAIDNLFTGLIIVACCQFSILKRNISTITHGSFDEHELSRHQSNCRKFTVNLKANKKLENSFPALPRNKCDDGNEKLYGEMKKCVEHSTMIFDFVEDLQDVFGNAILLQFIVNCLIICLTAYHIAHMQNFAPEDFIGFAMYFLCMIYQIFIYCFHGTELQIHATDVALGTYSCKWWIESPRFKHALRIIMIRTQRPLILRAGNIMQLSLQTFVGIIQMSYSIFTVMQSLSKRG